METVLHASMNTQRRDWGEAAEVFGIVGLVSPAEAAEPGHQSKQTELLKLGCRICALFQCNSPPLGTRHRPSVLRRGAHIDERCQ